MNLHYQAIEWVINQFPATINNHYAKEKIKFDGLIPDVVGNDQIHEIEVVSDKAAYEQIPKIKTMWIFIPSFRVFDHINILGQVNNHFVPLHNLSTEVIDEQKETRRLKTAIVNLKTKRNRLIREIKTLQKQHKVEKGKAHRVLYLLPSFQFKKILNPDKCAVCNEESDLIIASESIGNYGLCKVHFDALVKIEELNI